MAEINSKHVILVVEDDADVPKVLIELIGDLADVTVATTVEGAKSQLEQTQWSLVILDVGLPDGSGLELIPLLKSGEGQPVPVIIFSANETGDEIAGLVDCALVKSQTTNDELLQTIVEMISKQQYRIEMT